MVETTYDQDFYIAQMGGSYRSASIMLAKLASIWKPASVVDVGCGRGTWLAAWQALGAKRLVGLDGPWNSQADMAAPEIEFRSTDLNAPFRAMETFDLAMSLEVAEHCLPESSEPFVDSLSTLADTIVFGAAYTAQPGTEHINCRPHSFWCQKFIGQGYAVFDFFRPKFWGVLEVEPWYQQNTFVYCRPHSRAFSALVSAGERPMENPAFVDAVHPWLFDFFKP